MDSSRKGRILKSEARKECALMFSLGRVGVYSTGKSTTHATTQPKLNFSSPVRARTYVWSYKPSWLSESRSKWSNESNQEFSDG
jgi:hypothetical protein